MWPYYCELGPCLGNNWDLIAGGGWCTDYPDPYAVLVTFPTANPFADYPSLASAKYTAKIRAAARLVGNRRLRVFGKLVPVLREHRVGRSDRVGTSALS